MRPGALALGFAAAVSLASEACAGNLYVPNASFESPATSYVVPQVDFWSVTPQPGDFESSVFGPWSYLAGVFLNTSGQPDSILNASGTQLAYLFNYPQLGLLQDYTTNPQAGPMPGNVITAVYEPGRSYHLTVGLTGSTDEPLASGASLALSLYYRDSSDAIVTIASTNVTYDPAVFTNLQFLHDFTVTVPTVNATNAWAGQHIGVLVMSTTTPAAIGGVWDLDKVRLTETIEVPNFSFELPSVAYVMPTINDWQVAPQPPLFDPNIFGPWDNLVGVFANTPPSQPDSVLNAAGSQLAYLFAYPGMGISQDYNSSDWTGPGPLHLFQATYDVGKAYTLTAGLTSSSDEPLTPGSTLWLGLYYRDGSGNQIPITGTTVTYDTNVFTNLQYLLDFSVTLPEVKATDPWAGQYIGVEFLSTVSPYLIGGVWDLDNVRVGESVATAINYPNFSGGQYSFTLQSEPGLALEILSAANPATAAGKWTSLGTLTNVTGTASFTDTNGVQAQLFYRARQLP